MLATANWRQKTSFHLRGKNMDNMENMLTLIWLAAAILAIIGMWKVFEKARQPGWASLVPFYNFYILLKIVGRPGWWLVLVFIPIVGIVIAAIVAIDVAKSFG